MKTLKNILKKDVKGKPILKLILLEKTAVNTITQNDYWTLMRVYKLGNWELGDEHSPIKINFWRAYKEKTCILAGVNFYGGEKSRFGFSNKDFYLENNWNVIPTQEFYEKQKITPEMLKEINEYFDKGK